MSCHFSLQSILFSLFSTLPPGIHITENKERWPRWWSRKTLENSFPSTDTSKYYSRSNYLKGTTEGLDCKGNLLKRFSSAKEHKGTPWERQERGGDTVLSGPSSLLSNLQIGEMYNWCSRKRSSNPTRSFQSMGLCTRKQSPERLALKTGKLTFGSLKRVWGVRKLRFCSSREHTKSPTCSKSQLEAVVERSLGKTHLLILESLPERQEANGTLLGGENE